jgi:hypothetical protein
MHSQFSSPTSSIGLDGPSEWPTPPYATRDPWLSDDGPVPVRIETARGFDIEGEMLAFDPQRLSLIFRFDQDGMALRVQFHRMRKLTLCVPMTDDTAGRETKLRFTGQIRKYKVALNGDGKLMGRTASHVETRVGLFLFEPDEGEATVFRSFVPSSAYTRCVLGPSVEEDAAERWIATPAGLLAALQVPQTKRKAVAIGEAIYNLGVTSARQLGMALETQANATKKQPLGEMLVSQGLLSRADLRTALGHKMGYPLVDVRVFPMDVSLLRLLPIETAYEHHAMPLMMHGDTLVVAVDNLARVAQLNALPTLAGLRIAPVLARESHIELALLRTHEDFGHTLMMTPELGWKLTAPMAA